MNDKTYPLPATLVQALVNYLSTKPYCEVVNLMADLHRIAAQVDHHPIPGNGHLEEHDVRR